MPIALAKFPQSCLVIEKGGIWLASDPDSIADALLDAGVRLHGNADVRALLENLNEVLNGELVEVRGQEMLPDELPHVPMANGLQGPPNIGCLIAGVPFHLGDGAEQLGLETLLLVEPNAGPTSIRGACVFVQLAGGTTDSAMRYDFFMAHPERLGGYSPIADVVVLGPDESAEL